MKQQLLIVNRTRQRAPNLSALDRFLPGFWSSFSRPTSYPAGCGDYPAIDAAEVSPPAQAAKVPIVVFSRPQRQAWPKGPSPELIQAIVELKRHNPRFGCPRIAQQINKTFGINIDKDVGRRILATHYAPVPGGGGPSWLSCLGHTKNSLWSIDLFRCESILLQSHWVLVVVDQFTRRIIGFGVHAGDVDGIALCRMFNTAISSKGVPKYLSSDNDPLFLYHPWQANLRILGTDEVKTVPYTPLSHPFVERLIGTIRREFLDQRSSGMPTTWSESWWIFTSITTRTVRTLRLTVAHPQSCPKNAKSTTLTSVDSAGNHIAMVYISCLWPLKQ